MMIDSAAALQILGPAAASFRAKALAHRDMVAGGGGGGGAAGNETGLIHAGRHREAAAGDDVDDDPVEHSQKAQQSLVAGIVLLVILHVLLLWFVAGCPCGRRVRRCKRKCRTRALSKGTVEDEAGMCVRVEDPKSSSFKVV